MTTFRAHAQPTSRKSIRSSRYERGANEPERPARAWESPDSAHNSSWSWRDFAIRVVVGYAVISAVLIALGLLIVHPLARSGVVHWDESVVRWLADHRTARLTSMSAFWSKSGDAPSIVAVGLVLAVVLSLRRLWHEVIVLASILAVELGTFLTISYTVGRTRPTVVHLGSVPSTGSFPSGHIAATIVVYGFVVVLLHRFTMPVLLQAIAAVWTIVAAISVGWARMYRGMHHPLDVMAGAAMGIALLAVFRAALVAASHGRNRFTRAGSLSEATS